MKPYYQDDNATLYLGDSREVFPSLPPPDLVVTDPPYGETRHQWDRWPVGWPSLLVSIPQFWCWGSLRVFWEHREEFEAFRLAQDAIWEKQNGTSMHNDRFRRVHELVVHFYPKASKWRDLYHQAVRIPTGKPKTIRRQMKPSHWGQVGKGTYEQGSLRLVRSVMRARNSHREGTSTTGKPVAIMRDLITYSCPPGGVVADLFVGSGSTLIAAREAGRRCIGIDASEAELEKAAKRLQQQFLQL